MTFQQFNELIKEQFALMSKQPVLFRSRASGHQLWEAYISSFSKEDDPEIVEAYGKSTRRKAGRKTKEQELNELRLAIVTSILDTRIKEQEDAAEALQVKAHNQKIMDLIARKKDAELEAMSAEDLQKLLK